MKFRIAFLTGVMGMILLAAALGFTSQDNGFGCSGEQTKKLLRQDIVDSKWFPSAKTIEISLNDVNEDEFGIFSIKCSAALEIYLGQGDGLKVIANYEVAHHLIQNTDVKITGHAPLR